MDLGFDFVVDLQASSQSGSHSDSGLVLVEYSLLSTLRSTTDNIQRYDLQ